MTTKANIINSAKPFLLAAGAALLLAGCGSSKKDDATTGGHSGSPRSLASDAYRYSACMRSHGVPSFPYPHVVSKGSGKKVLGIQPPPQSVAASPRFEAAQEACEGIVPGAQFATAKQQGEAERARARYLLAFARCLRAHGVSGFPDPDAQGQITPEIIHAAGIDVHSPAVLNAARACAGATHGAVTLTRVRQR